MQISLRLRSVDDLSVIATLHKDFIEWVTFSQAMDKNVVVNVANRVK